MEFIPQFINKLIFEDDSGLPFTLVQPLTYITNVAHFGTIRVPEGFKTDLASIRPKFMWLIFPPYGRYDAPAVIHDYLYDRFILSRKASDAVLIEAMKVKGINWPTRWAFYLGVRLGGGRPWNRYRRRDAAQRGQG